ncbi:guanine nucleotide-binding protein-like 1 [Maniola hyperantus]|uniref:guanine nucleotide-binding protein-like 1 n=1 Tax=Aphantopus hyperantus TaxID=2795564 RepID=UPI0015689742|nr:guanine nucleotide-binding protein-like 1 [Maniola hyperantus]XP_034838962.1 guanine nucleotide-binding protein-like 1 [Maniola hyperantus]XP_034838964.1 guanine nucleotide-binding protein-like 1 [Maniola hyperantus]
MPQARRKTPFSGKAKKQQLQAKKNKTLIMNTSSGTNSYDVVSVNYQPNRSRGRGDANRYALKFYRESDEELRMKKEDALKSLNPVSEKEMEIDPTDFFPKEISFPKRPPWDFSMTPAQLDAQEQKYFREYIQVLQASPHWKEMSYFELNLETWRQLWRVLEMCDILLLIVDVRYAGMMFPPSLYEYVVNEQKKNMILVLNKIDLVPASVVAAWKQFLVTRCPELRVVYFTSCPGYNLAGATSDKAGLNVRRRKGRQRMCAEGATKILEACKDIVTGEVDLSSWEKKIKEETNLEFEDDETEVGETILEKSDTTFYTHERYKNGILTIGCVGQPNVGKSSLMNAIMGKKVVSVSKTPGHTKHFQTIFLTPEVRLCDCPGLVFPSKVPRPIQILMGSYPIAQLREPYTTIRYLAERLDLPRLLRMDHPENDDTWSPRDICDGWAKKRGYLTAKAARLDTYRAANSILRMALDGKICLWLRPPNFTEEREKFESCEEIKYVKWVQALTKDEDIPSSSIPSSDTDDRSADDDSSADESDDDDSDERTEIVNKFAALAGDD